MLPGGLVVFGAEKDVRSDVIDSGRQTLYGYERLVRAEAQIPRVFTETPAL